MRPVVESLEEVEEVERLESTEHKKLALIINILIT
jgi:hypothetical protein